MTSEDAVVIATTFLSSGMYTFTLTMGNVTAGHTQIGLADSNTGTGLKQYLGWDTNSVGVWASGDVLIGGRFVGNLNVSYAAGNAVDVAVDLTNKLLWMRVNQGNWNGNVANAPGRTGGFSLASLSSSRLTPAVDLYTTKDSVTANFTNNLGITGFTPWGDALSSPTPTAITFSPTNPQIPDNSPAGTLIANATVTMSDGSQFAGTLTTSNTSFFAISGSKIVTARALTSADDGTQSTVITASQSSQAISVEFSI
jgi:hypothetical protein